MSSSFFGSVSIGQIKSTVDKNSKWEVYYDRVPVSGEIRVGAITSERDSKIIPSKFYVRIPEHKENNLSVEVSSRDGRYEANLPYDIKRLKPNSYEFELPTKHV